jgi:hypothetical protein
MPTDERKKTNFNRKERIEHKKLFLCDLCALCGGLLFGLADLILGLFGISIFEFRILFRRHLISVSCSIYFNHGWLAVDLIPFGA